MQIRQNLHNVTFVIPVRIDSEERRANLETLLNVFTRDFHTYIIVLEAGKNQCFNVESNNLTYHFVYDESPVFHRTKYINQLFRLATTPIVAVWDTDAIAIPAQVLDAAEQITQNKAVMAFPYDGRFYGTNQVLSNLFRQTLRYDVFTQNVALMDLMHGYYSCGGAFLVNKEKYLEAGGENENFYGWGPEDAERVRRMEIFKLPVYYAQGLLFHLWHPRKGWFDSLETEKQNRKEFIKTCFLETSPYLIKK
jgi:hypothetical protein